MRDIHVPGSDGCLAERRGHVVQVWIPRGCIGMVCDEPIGQAACPPTRVGAGESRFGEADVRHGLAVGRVRSRLVSQQVRRPGLYRDGAVFYQRLDQRCVDDAATRYHR